MFLDKFRYHKYTHLYMNYYLKNRLIIQLDEELLQTHQKYIFVLLKYVILLVVHHQHNTYHQML